MITVSTAGMVAYRVSILGETIDLRTIPSIVGGDQEKRHGIVLAKSVPAKKYGIQTGEAIMTAKQKCPGLVIVPPDYGLYVTASRAFIGILKQYSDNVIQYSIDEAWVVFDGYESLYGRGQMVKFAYDLKEEIKEKLGFTVNIGISNNFLLSKMAGDFSKPDKVHTLFPDEIKRKMWPFPVSDLFFVGRATTKKLLSLGIKTIGELARADERIIRTHLKLPGQIIQGYARGEDLQPYMFTHEAKQMQLLSPTDVTEEIYRAACQIFDELWDKSTPIRQLGVGTSKVQAEASHQYNLFDLEKHDRLEKLNRTIDDIRGRFGEDSVMRASFLQSNITHMSGGLDKERRSGVTIGIDVENEKVRVI